MQTFTTLIDSGRRVVCFLLMLMIAFSPAAYCEPISDEGTKDDAPFAPYPPGGVAETPTPIQPTPWPSPVVTPSYEDSINPTFSKPSTTLFDFPILEDTTRSSDASSKNAPAEVSRQSAVDTFDETSVDFGDDLGMPAAGFESSHAAPDAQGIQVGQAGTMSAAPVADHPHGSHSD